MFQRLATQWRMGSRGPIGLDLNVMFTIASLKEMSRDAQLQMADDLAIMESVWLEEWRGAMN